MQLFGFISVLLGLLGLAIGQGLELTAFPSEKEAIEFINDSNWKTESLVELLSAENVQSSMERGWFSLTKEIIRLAKENEKDVSTAVYQTSSKIKKELKQIQNLLQNASKKGNKPISPAFQWAQSGDSIFLNVKTAHKIDAPSTIGCETEIQKFESKKMELLVNCKSAGKKFGLNLDLFDEIDAESSKITSTSVGRINIVLKKAKTSVWKRLLQSHKKLNNMGVWWSLREKYEDELDDLESKVEEAKRQERLEAMKEKAEAAKQKKAEKAAAAAEAEELEKKNEEEEENVENVENNDNDSVEPSQVSETENSESEIAEEEESTVSETENTEEESSEGNNTSKDDESVVGFDEL
eukprot:TRINITY_DN2646_c0_g1_i2.p1 TRINITY_DN2646_c0_g1~~TRINITY_DN2646_c0_g1_i2.p1  ORF type:complete len:353 (+),score=138.17 TRINITY_DN2646_c0_g1_i2:43-1101(+)